MFRKFLLFPALRPFFLIVMLLVLWDLSIRVFGIAAYLVPPPMQVVHQLIAEWPRLLAEGWKTTLATLGRFGRFGLTVVIGIPIAMVIAYSRVVESYVYPLLVFSQSVPKVAIAPRSWCGSVLEFFRKSSWLPVSGGSLALAGASIKGAQNDVGIVFQSAVLLAWRNIEDNILRQTEIRRLPKAASRERARELMRVAGWQVLNANIRGSCLAACSSARQFVERCCMTRRCY